MRTTPQYLIQNLENYPDESALSIKDDNGNWDTDTWKDVYEKVLEVSKALVACGIKKNDKVSIYSYNERMECMLCGYTICKCSLCRGISHMFFK